MHWTKTALPPLIRGGGGGGGEIPAVRWITRRRARRTIPSDQQSWKGDPDLKLLNPVRMEGLRQPVYIAGAAQWNVRPRAENRFHLLQGCVLSTITSASMPVSHESDFFTLLGIDTTLPGLVQPPGRGPSQSGPFLKRAEAASHVHSFGEPSGREDPAAAGQPLRRVCKGFKGNGERLLRCWIIGAASFGEVSHHRTSVKSGTLCSPLFTLALGPFHWNRTPLHEQSFRRRNMSSG